MQLKRSRTKRKMGKFLMTRIFIAISMASTNLKTTSRAAITNRVNLIWSKNAYLTKKTLLIIFPGIPKICLIMLRNWKTTLMAPILMCKVTMDLHMHIKKGLLVMVKHLARRISSQILIPVTTCTINSITVLILLNKKDKH